MLLKNSLVVLIFFSYSNNSANQSLFFNYSCLHFIIIFLAAVFLWKSTSRSEQARVGFISYCDVYCVFYTKKEHIYSWHALRINSCQRKRRLQCKIVLQVKNQTNSEFICYVWKCDLASEYRMTSPNTAENNKHLTRGLNYLKPWRWVHVSKHSYLYF